ncbi:MAG: ComF family protein [Spirochaetales bacterium]|nr:ComF family protein [Spirochaetales bacterium]
MYDFFRSVFIVFFSSPCGGPPNKPQGTYSFPDSQLCPICGRFAPSDQAPCCYCLDKDYHFQSNKVLLQFSVEVEKLLKDFKFRKHKQSTEILCNELINYLTTTCDRPFSICIVPSNPHSIAKKGFDHSRVISKYLENKTNFKIFSPFIRKKGKAQKELNLKQRQENLRNQIYLAEQIKILPPKDERIFVVDDIFTTGSSLDHCSRLLTQLGYKEIYSITFTAKISGTL